MKYIFFFLLCSNLSFSQNNYRVKAIFNPETKTIDVEQQIVFKNTFDKSLNEIYLQDWNHSYSSKESELANKFTDEFDSRMYYANKNELSYTTIKYVSLDEVTSFERLENKLDIIKLNLRNPLKINQSIKFIISYSLQLPDFKFSKKGIDKNLNVYLYEWLLTTTDFNHKFLNYTNLDVDDQTINPSDFNIEISFPNEYNIFTDLKIVKQSIDSSVKKIVLEGISTNSTNIQLTKTDNFYSIKSDIIHFQSNISDNKISDIGRTLIIDNILSFLKDRLGSINQEKIVISKRDNNRNPLYGLNKLPSFLNPYPKHLKWELDILHSTIQHLLENNLIIDKRKDYWLKDGLAIYLLQEYINEYYGNLLIGGKFTKIPILGSYELIKNKFNYQFKLIPDDIESKFLQQSLTTPKSKLINFNKNIANKYLASNYISFLSDYVGEQNFKEYLTLFFKQKGSIYNTSDDFINNLNKFTKKDISWFYNLIDNENFIDFSIEDVNKTNEFLFINLKNKYNNKIPVKIYLMKNDSIQKSFFIDEFKNTKQVVIKNDNYDKIIINKNKLIPDENENNNIKIINNKFIKKPLKPTLITDFHNPEKQQLYLNPEISFNVYDGLISSLSISNKAIVNKRFEYNIRPSYGLNSKTLIGTASFFKRHFIKNKNLFDINYGTSFSSFHYFQNLRYNRFVPFLNFNFRDKLNYRNNDRASISARLISVQRERDLNLIDISEEPDYKIFNLRLRYSDVEFTEGVSYSAGLELHKSFSKLSYSINYRKRITKNRDFSSRIFLGKFIKNNSNTDYYSFALDRPTDYLFDYDYYARSDASGIWSQQYITADGGFKSQFLDQYANKWMITNNSSITLWKYIRAYGDFGLFKNKNLRPKYRFDSGLQVNLVKNYFELYFPIYSTHGLEIKESDYVDRIRFKASISVDTFFKFIRRKWY